MSPDAKPFRRRRAKFANVGVVLDGVLSSLGLAKRLRERALIDIWPSLVGEPFASRSRPLFLDFENNLVVSTKDASTAQEMSLTRKELIRKVQIVAKGLSLNVVGMRFDLKHFHKSEREEGPIAEYSSPAIQLPQPTREALASVELDDQDRQSLAALTGNMSECSREISERIRDIVEQQARLETWRRLNGFPVCSECSRPTHKLHSSGSLCATCHLRHQSENLK